jgi:homogentisate 1,2-dioxygenase
MVMMMMMMMRGGGACQMKIVGFGNLEVDDVDVMILPHGFCFAMDHVDHDVAMMMMLLFCCTC